MGGFLVGLVILLVFWGIPLFLAVYPSICALIMRRPWLAALLLIAGLTITFAIPTLISRQQAASGVFRDGLGFLVAYWIYSVPYAVVGSVIVAILGKRSAPVAGHGASASTDPPGGVAPWIEEMRRERERRDTPNS